MALYSHGDLPDGWISIKVGRGDLLHFCSLHCLHEWVAKQMPVVESSMVEYANSSGPGPLSLEAVNEYWRDL